MCQTSGSRSEEDPWPTAPDRCDTGPVDIPPEDVRIDVARMLDDGPCGVRVIHTPTGMTVEVDDQDSTEANRELALAQLRQMVSDSECPRHLCHTPD